MALIQARHYILQSQSLVLQQHGQVIEQVGGFVDELLPVLGHGGQGHFDPLFPDLLGDALGAFGIEASGVAGGRIRPLARGQDLLELGEKTERRHRVGIEAGGGTQVASRADRVGGDEQGVAVAVGADGDEIEHMARAFAFGPEALLAAAKEGDLASGQGLCQRLRGHEALHQQLTAGGVLHHGGDHAIALGPVEPVDEGGINQWIIHG